MSRSNPMHHGPDPDPEEIDPPWPFPPALLDYPGLPPLTPGRVIPQDLREVDDAPF